MNMTIEEKNKVYDYLSEYKSKFIYKKDKNHQVNSMNYLLNQFPIDRLVLIIPVIE